MQVENLKINDIIVKYNPRHFFDVGLMDELRKSIQSKGILVPLKVRPMAKGKFELVYGERRLRAAKELNLETVPCLVDDDLDDATARIQKGIENISRGNLHYLEQGAYFTKLLDEKIGGVSTQEDVAAVFGIAQNTVSTMIKIWNYLYSETKEYIVPVSFSDNPILHSDTKLSLVDIGYKHALLLTKLHAGLLNIESQVNLSLPDNKELAREIVDEFTAKCKYMQLKMCQQTNDENLSIKKLDAKIDQLVKELKDALTQRLTDERSRSCFAWTDQETKILVYNRDASLMVNDLDTELDGIDTVKRRFGYCHLVVTAPPCFVDKGFDAFDDWDDYLDSLETVIKAGSRILVPGGHFAIIIADAVLSQLDGSKVETLIMPEIVKFMEKNDLSSFAQIIWDKGNSLSNNDLSVDNQVPIEYRVQRNWEYCFVFRKKGKRQILPSVALMSRLSREDWQIYVDGIWHIPAITPFPLEIANRLIKMYSVEGDTVLDPFSGLGTVAIAARNLKRSAVMYELDKGAWQQQVDALTPVKDGRKVE
jgi:ParB/RepB/Spo0J family partition protein